MPNDINLSPFECAIVSTQRMTDMTLYTPNLPEGAPLPPIMEFLMAVFTRFHHDPAFFAEQRQWFDEFYSNKGTV